MKSRICQFCSRSRRVILVCDHEPRRVPLKERWQRLWKRLPRPRTTLERNVYLLYGEVVFAAILAAAAAFNATYILRWGGSPALIGLLSSAPALIAVFLFMPAARILERQRRYGPYIVWSLFGARIGYLLIALLPFFLAQWVPEATTFLLIAMAAPSVLFSTGWNPLLADVVPEQFRANVFAWRSILSSGTIAALTYVIGLLLDRGEFPRNYQWLYLVGIVGGLLSVLFVARIKIPETEPAQAPLLQRRASPLQGVREGLAERPMFGRLTINTLVFNLGAWMLGPLYIIFFVQELGALDSWVGLFTAVVHVAIMVGFWAWRRISMRMGDFPSLLVALPIVTTFPFLVALLPNLTIILIIGLVIHLFVPGVDLNHNLIFTAGLPPGRRHTCVAFYSMVMNIGAFVCPIVGVALAEAIGIRATLALGGLLRIVGVVLFYRYPMDDRRPDLRVLGGALQDLFRLGR